MEPHQKVRFKDTPAARAHDLVGKTGIVVAVYPPSRSLHQGIVVETGDGPENRWHANESHCEPINA